MGRPDEPLHALAEAAGLQRWWRDVDGREHFVADEALRAILEALGYRVGSERQMVAGLRACEVQQNGLPALVTADVGSPIALPFACERAEVSDSAGRTMPLAVSGGSATAPDAPGYYDANFDGQVTRLAVAPLHCPSVPRGSRRPWGVSLQIPSLRSSRASAFGNFGELAEAVEALAASGADAVAINPVHALFPGDGTRFSPYSPSSRQFYNTAMADPGLVGLPELPQDSGGPLIAWDTALPDRLAQLRRVYESLDATGRQAFGTAQTADTSLLRHALFDALDGHFRAKGVKGWQNWPAHYRTPDGEAVAEFARQNAAEVAFHLFLQRLTEAGLTKVQESARTSGMSIGLIGDLAVGVDPGGSDSWSFGSTMLQRLTIGAPPDTFSPHGQNWALTSFSPQGLRDSGFAPWIAMIRAALAGCGGLRIDHAFGLARLWVIPAGGSPAEGAYLTYPFSDLMRLLTLEAHLAGAFIIAEDLGTAPHDFTQAITARRMLGMRVLWFQRAEDHGFVGAQDYDSLAVAMTGTHDTPTVAGWWRGTDLDWAAQLGRLPADVDRTKAEEIRDWDRGLLWSTLSGSEPRPAPDDTAPVVDAALRHIAQTPSALAIVPIEDILGLTEQPNLPGTIDEHPNWRRRLEAPLATLLDEPHTRNRTGRLAGK